MSSERGPSNESINSRTDNPTKISQKIIKDFSEYSVNIGELIRKGKYGAVYEGRFGSDFNAQKFGKEFKCESYHQKRCPKADEKFCLKYIDVPLRKQLGVEDADEAVVNETKALTAITNSGTVSLFFYLKLSGVDQWFLFMELADGNLQSLIKKKNRSKQKMDFNSTKTWIKSLTECLKSLHQNGISHGSIKSSNILFFSRNEDQKQIDLKIADFVLSHVTTEQQMKNQTIEEKQLMEDRMDEDVFDIYFVFTEILNLTEFQSEDQKKTALDSIRGLITSEGNSVNLLNSLLNSKYLS